MLCDVRCALNLSYAQAMQCNAICNVLIAAHMLVKFKGIIGFMHASVDVPTHIKCDIVDLLLLRMTRKTDQNQLEDSLISIDSN